MRFNELPRLTGTARREHTPSNHDWLARLPLEGTVTNLVGDLYARGDGDVAWGARVGFLHALATAAELPGFWEELVADFRRGCNPPEEDCQLHKGYDRKEEVRLVAMKSHLIRRENGAI